MNLPDLIIILIVAIFFVAALLYVRRNGTCTDDCQSCHAACKKNRKQNRTNDGVPAFVEAYRKDHPKEPKE